MESLLLEHVRDTARIPERGGLAAYALILLGALILNLDGIGRSLWLDEAWVANSVRQSSLGGMFYYPEWLQTSPPLFLLLARWVTGVFGFTTVALRVVPLLFALLAAAGMLAVARRVVAAPVALVAAAMLVFHPLPVEYFRSFKQYGAEMAATTGLLFAAVTYLQSPDRRGFLWLLGAATLLPLSYPLAFLLPGVVLAVFLSGLGGTKRAILLAGVSAAVLAVLYFVFIRANVAPDLWTFWGANPDPRYGGGAAVIAIAAAVVAYTVWRIVVHGMTWREWTLVICVLPCALLLLAEVSGWYPASPRTRLFVRPCFLLALAIAADDLFARVASRWRPAPIAVWVAAVVVMGWGLRMYFTEARNVLHEDYAAAIRSLRSIAAPGDLLLVHPSVREGFRLYADIEDWHPAVVYGDTGWPCCPRGHSAGPRSSSAEAVKQDLDTKIPVGTPGHFWLLYTTWGAHWEYTGLNDGDLWKRLLKERGCQPGKDAYPLHVTVIEMVCPANSP